MGDRLRRLAVRNAGLEGNSERRRNLVHRRVSAPSASGRQPWGPGDVQPLIPMSVFESQSGERPSPGPRRLKEAVLFSFQGSAREVAEQFRRHSLSDWQAIQVWLDISGLALYLLARVRQLEI